MLNSLTPWTCKMPEEAKRPGKFRDKSAVGTMLYLYLTGSREMRQTGESEP